MIHKIFTIYDEKAKAYLPPFFLPQEGMAVRTFKDCINSDTHQFGANPHDYTLFTLGHWDDNTAEINILGRSQALGNGVEFKNPPQPDLYDVPDETKVSHEAPVLRGSEGGNSAE